MITVSTGEIPFRNQFCLRDQPVLDLMPIQRTLVHIGEISASRYFV
jgi:hypothetical protein